MNATLKEPLCPITLLDKAYTTKCALQDLVSIQQIRVDKLTSVFNASALLLRTMNESCRNVKKKALEPRA